MLETLYRERKRQAKLGQDRGEDCLKNGETEDADSFRGDVETNDAIALSDRLEGSSNSLSLKSAIVREDEGSIAEAKFELSFDYESPAVREYEGFHGAGDRSGDSPSAALSPAAIGSLGTEKEQGEE